MHAIKSDSLIRSCYLVIIFQIKNDITWSKHFILVIPIFSRKMFRTFFPEKGKNIWKTVNIRLFKWIIFQENILLYKFKFLFNENEESVLLWLIKSELFLVSFQTFIFILFFMWVKLSRKLVRSLLSES